MKNFAISRLVPFYHRVKWKIEDRRNLNMTTVQVFSKIYNEKTWSGGIEDGAFYSGDGSTQAKVVKPYIKPNRRIQL